MRADRIICLSLLIAHGASAQAKRVQIDRVLGARAAVSTVTVKAWNPSGSIRFVGWDKDSVVVRGVVGSNMQFIFAGTSDGLKLGAEGHWSDGKATASDFVVYLPRRAMVSVKTVDADITSSDVSGWFYSVSGNLRLAGLASSIEAESMSGSLDLNVNVPWIKARTGRGHLLLRGAPQDVDVSTVSGSLSIGTSSVLRGVFSSVAGDIHYAGLPLPRSIIEMTSHSGAVELLIPTNASASLALSSVSGSIENDFGQVRPISSGPRAMRINLGHGDAQLTVRTFKGPIRLKPQ